MLLGEALRRQGEVHDRRLGGAEHGQHPAVVQRHAGDQHVAGKGRIDGVGWLQEGAEGNSLFVRVGVDPFFFGCAQLVRRDVLLVGVSSLESRGFWLPYDTGCCVRTARTYK